MVHLTYDMNTHWQFLSMNSVRKGYEFLLSAFNGTCYKCGENVHKANKCPKNSNNKGKGKGEFKKFLGKCNNCSKIGHKVAGCWELEKNKDRRPYGYKTAGEKVIPNADYDGITFSAVMIYF